VSGKPFHGTLKKIPAEEPIASTGDAMTLFEGAAHRQFRPAAMDIPE
jgi:hypothetical protein